MAAHDRARRPHDPEAVRTATREGRAIGAALLFLVLLGGCANSSGTDQTLRSFVGRPIDAFMQKYGYPDSKLAIPNGNVVYAFSRGSGGRVDAFGNITSAVCRVWLEVDASGKIVGYHYENCT